jgi:hypothetical protein
MMVDHGTFLVSTTYLTDAMAIDRTPGTAQEGLDVFPKAKRYAARQLLPGFGSRAAPTPQRCRTGRMPRSCARWSSGDDADAGTAGGHLTSADLIDAADDLGRLAPGYLADIIAVPGDPSIDISTTLDVCFVMKDGQVVKQC